MREITKGIWAIDDLRSSWGRPLMGRSYLIEDRAELTLIDTSRPPEEGTIVAAIESIGRRIEELRTIVVTHYHWDHTGNAGALREASGAPICAHPEDAPYIDGRQPWGTGRPNPTAWLENMIGPAPYALSIDKTIVEGDVLPVAGGLEVFHVPGHTPGSIALYAKEHGVLFAGDMFMNVFGLQLPPANSSHDMAQARHSIVRLSQLEFDHALPGHGAPVLSKASEKLRAWSRNWL